MIEIFWTQPMDRWLLFLVAASCTGLVLGGWFVENYRHRRLTGRIPIRVHVNGIRGKSSLVRMIAGALRAGNIETIAKTTGSATRVIDADGEEHPVERRGAPTIIEQVAVLRRHVRPTTGAMVFECMAIRPDYQDVSENRIVRSTDGVILNVGRDHMDVLGTEIPEIARSLANTVPAGGHLYVGERDGEALAILREAARRRDTTIHEFTGEEISADDMRSMGPFVFPENVAIALAIAERHGVPRDTALDGIRAAEDDPGASKMVEHAIGEGTFYWVDLFSVNDTASVVENVERVIDWIGQEPVVHVMLNNREDRPDRAEQFADFLVDGMSFESVLLAGGYQDEMAARLIEGGIEETRISQLGEPDEDAVDELVREMVDGAGNRPVALIGMANIHTDAAATFRRRLGRASRAEGSGKGGSR